MSSVVYVVLSVADAFIAYTNRFNCRPRVVNIAAEYKLGVLLVM